MKTRIIWLVVSSWMVIAPLLTSCAPAAVKEEAEKVAPPKEKEEVVVPKEVVPKKETNLVKWTGTKLDGTVVEKMMEKPRYGGVHIISGRAQPPTFDDITRRGGDSWAAGPVQEAPMANDWTRGPQGTHEWAGIISVDPVPELLGGLLAESWKLPEPDVIVWRIRQGVHFALDPTSEASRLVGGRELTAADVAFSLGRQWTKGYPKTNYPYLSDMKNPANSIYVSPTDKWAVVVKTAPGMAGQIFRSMVGGWNKTIAPEVIEKYGEITSGKWKHVVGTGPFMLKEYVVASSLTYVRNPNYWGYDPFFPENQLPYLDGFKVLIIPDVSTQMAALRTGKIDTLGPGAGEGGGTEITAEDARSLMKTNPKLQWAKYLTGGLRLFMRNDTKPFDDIRVRRALAMGINRQELLDLYYEGDAVMFYYPIPPIAELMPLYVPLDKMPQSVREVFEYNPDKAKQLLAEAGYPQGFKTEIIALTEDVDLLSIIKEYWAKIGVDLKIEVRDNAVWRSIAVNKSHKQIYASAPGDVPMLIWGSTERIGGRGNLSFINEPWHKILYERMAAEYFDPVKSRAVLTTPMAEGLPSWVEYFNEKQWYIYLPAPYSYTFWQPWLKSYDGTNEIGHHISLGWSRYVWIDQALKKAMGR